MHNEAHIPAFYYATKDASPLLCNVRVHTMFVAEGDDMNAAFAERREVAPKIVFDEQEIPNPAKNALVAVEEGEVYRVGVTDKAFIGFIRASVTRLRSEEAALYAAPDL